MLRVSRLADYATSVMTCLGERPGEVTSAGQLAECLELEPPTVSKLLKLLTRAGLLESCAGGGYRIIRPVADISVADIVEAVDGPISMTDCSVAGGMCGREATCMVRNHWRLINARVDAALRAISVADLMQPADMSDSPQVPVDATARN